MRERIVEFESKARAAMSGLHTTMTRSQYSATLMKYGDWFFWNGVPRVFRAKHVGGGIWSVWSEVKL